MKNKLTIFIIGLILLLLFNVPATTSAAPTYTYGFDNISNNNALNATTGETQLKLDVELFSNDTALFTFINNGPYASSIADIYFDDDIDNPVLLSFIGFQASSGVSFSIGADPGELPSGNNFNFTSDYSYDSDSPAQPNGINPGESLGILFEKAVTDAQILSALANLNLRIGIHVQGFSDGGSESFINTPGTPDSPGAVPEPATFMLLGLGLIGAAGIGRQIKKY